MQRASGILLHISSLPSDYGIGTLGKCAYNFVDFLAKSRQRYWQILPIGMTSFGDSPYQSPSAFAGNINFIDLEILTNDGYLTKSDYDKIDWGKRLTKVDYAKIFKNRKAVLKKAVEKFDIYDKGYISFCNQSKWLCDFALFMAIKESFNLVSFNNWDSAFISKNKKAIDDFCKNNQPLLNFYKVTQYWFFKQYFNLKAYANKKGIKLIGDIPFYVAYDSADVWANPQNFELDESLNPINVAGVPPDFFSTDGQLWGNPLYNYSTMQKDNFSWWNERLSFCFKLYDILRIDHFRAFDSYYSIPFGEKTAKNGTWKKGVGFEFFEKLNLLDKNIIVEDLGDINDSVRDLVKLTGFPNMKVLQFAFDSDLSNDFLPHNFGKNCVVYTGTHDNMTTKGWFNALPIKSKKLFYKLVPNCFFKSKSKALVDYAFMSSADTAIIPIQDFLNLGNSARMNTPSTLNNNWQWRLKKKQLSGKLSTRIKKLTKKYNRVVN